MPRWRPPGHPGDRRAVEEPTAATPTRLTPTRRLRRGDLSPRARTSPGARPHGAVLGSLRQELRELWRGPLDPGSRDGAGSVVVDWTAAPFLTMAGVAVLDDFRRQAGERGVPVRVVASRRWPRAVLRIVAFDDLVPVAARQPHRARPQLVMSGRSLMR
ncbi:STAS domain-containing protein [Streptomyces sp. DSM 41640]|uniref:STAS domain-containing protein n=1 Tax=Streptomyces doebereineriae TaxID=3075528 RepID=A0ABU2VEJ7_9ACTN|nr:STAS domain-containing protein [Streptomyces sp. DSM 41640]MDT0483986.1 STAS domain-containing protein [Streptomyces sp. DSM 41640]